MRMPGLTATCSLYRTTGRYQTSPGAGPSPAAVEAAGGSIARGECLYPPSGHGPGCGEVQQGGGVCGLNGVRLATDCTPADIIAKFARCRRNGCLNSVYEAATCTVTCR
jgi:hypothetical protein